MNRREFLRSMAVGGAGLLAPQWVCGEQPPHFDTFTYKTAGGCEIKLDAWRPPSPARLPVIVHIHGGALIMGSRRGVPKWITAQNDYAVISIDYRLAPETKLPEIIADVQDAFKWIHEKGPGLFKIDTSKVVVAGGSAGGYLTLMTGFCVKPRPRALIPVSGYGDITTPWYSRPSAFYLQQPHVSKQEAAAAVGTTCVTEGGGSRGNFYLYCRQNGIWPEQVTGHDPDTEPNWFDPYCPVRNISRSYPPTVLIHGTADTDVPYAESDAMDKGLSKFNVPHKFIAVPGGGHVLRGVPADQQAQIYADALAFVQKYV